jgi:O-antigen/teichoic acid export membrane protein
MMAFAAYTIALSFGLHMFANVSAEPSRLILHSDRQLRSGIAFAAVASLGLVLVGPYILSILGAAYAAHGSTALRLAALAAVPMVLTKSYLFTCRATRHIREGTLVAFVTGVAAVVAATASATSFGLAGMAGAWLAVQAVTGAGAAIRRRSLLRSATLQAQRADPSHATSPQVIASERQVGDIPLSSGI